MKIEFLHDCSAGGEETYSAGRVYDMSEKHARRFIGLGHAVEHKPRKAKKKEESEE